MDRLLRHALDAIACDHRSGAAELALRAVAALQAWQRRHPRPTEQELLSVARTLLRAQPSMAPLLRLANEVALAVDARLPARALAQSASGFGRLLRIAPRQIARRFARVLRRGPRRNVVTYSYSSTVVHALIRARSHIKCVTCSEGRPNYEGRAMAKKLAQAGVEVWLQTDAAVLGEIELGRDLVVLGADAVLRGGFANKVGTNAVVSLALRAQAPVWVLADTSKFWPERPYASSLWMWSYGDPSEVWKEASDAVRVENPYFEVTRIRGRLLLLTERGWMTPARVQRELRKMRISPRLRELAD